MTSRVKIKQIDQSTLFAAQKGLPQKRFYGKREFSHVK